MANKKFYYRNKNKSQRTDSASEVSADVLYTAEQLSQTLEELGISPATRELLSKNRINNAGDIVKRTEKDLYRIQGFNKKMLFEIKDSLKAAELSLRKETPKPRPQSDGASVANDVRSEKQPKPQKNPRERNRFEQEEPRGSKFGLADRRTEPKQQHQQPRRPQNNSRPVRPEKLTEPLSVENWRKVMKGGKWGFSDGFKIVVPTMYDEVFCFKEGLASVELEGKCGYIDKDNNIVVPFDYDTAMSFSEGFAMVVKGDKCGYINKDNEVVVPFEYDAATPFEGGEAKVKKDGKWATLTPDNKLVWI